MISVCREELSLFHNFFNSGEDEFRLVEERGNTFYTLILIYFFFSGYLDELSYPLYVTVRPIILQETRIDLLADVCLQLQEHITSSNLTTQQSESSRPNSPIPLQLSEPLSARSFDSLDNLEIPSKVVVRRILEDAQQRLVFRAQVYLRDDIQMFKMRDEEIISLFYRGTECKQEDDDGEVESKFHTFSFLLLQYLGQIQ